MAIVQLMIDLSMGVFMRIRGIRVFLFIYSNFE